MAYSALLVYDWANNTNGEPAMHELPIAENIKDIAIKHAEQADAKRITDIFLVIGQLSSVVDDSIQFYWDLISKDTLAEGATLHFKRIPAEIRCKSCSATFAPNGRDYSCPECGGYLIEIIAGDEFFMEAIEVE